MPNGNPGNKEPKSETKQDEKDDVANLLRVGKHGNLLGAVHHFIQ